MDRFCCCSHQILPELVTTIATVTVGPDLSAAMEDLKVYCMIWYSILACWSHSLCRVLVT